MLCIRKLLCTFSTLGIGSPLSSCSILSTGLTSHIAYRGGNGPRSTRPRGNGRHFHTAGRYNKAYAWTYPPEQPGLAWLAALRASSVARPQRLQCHSNAGLPGHKARLGPLLHLQGPHYVCVYAGGVPALQYTMHEPTRTRTRSRVHKHTCPCTLLIAHYTHTHPD